MVRERTDAGDRAATAARGLSRMGTVIVIGAGLAGLAAARRLVAARPRGDRGGGPGPGRRAYRGPGAGGRHAARARRAVARPGPHPDARAGRRAGAVDVPHLERRGTAAAGPAGQAVHDEAGQGRRSRACRRSRSPTSPRGCCASPAWPRGPTWSGRGSPGAPRYSTARRGRAGSAATCAPRRDAPTSISPARRSAPPRPATSRCCTRCSTRTPTPTWKRSSRSTGVPSRTG